MPKAVIELKTFCPESGVVLKYRTDKAAEVGRLIGQLGRMGRAMGGMEQSAAEKDVEMVDAQEPVTHATAAAASGAQGGQGAGGKKKKKGKK